MPTIRRFLVIVSTALCLTLCSVCAIGCSPGYDASQVALAAYVDATAQPFRKYVNEDPTLDSNQKARRFQSIDAAESYVASFRQRQSPTAIGGVTR